MVKAVIVRKGGPGSGHRGHAGRPGKVGGSSPGTGGIVKLGEYQLVSSYDDLYGAYENPKYWILPNGKLLDNGHGHYPDHRGSIETQADEQWIKDSRKAIVDELTEKYGEYREEDVGIMDAAFNAGAVRVGQYYEKVYVNTDNRDTRTLRKLQRYVDEGKLNLQADSTILWDAQGGFYRGPRYTYLEFMTAKHVGRDGELKEYKGGPGSGFHGHSGRPGKVGGSSPGKVWGGQQEQFEGKKLSKLQTGEIGEQLATQMLMEKFGAEFRTLNEGINNAPIDVAGDHMAVEVKTGLSTNGYSAQHWRATLGQFGKGEREFVDKLSASDKKEYLAFRQQQIMERKYSTVAKMSDMIGDTVKPYTVGVILSPDGSKGDVFMVPDFHLRLAWKDYATDDYYVGTFDVD